MTDKQRPTLPCDGCAHLICALERSIVCGGREAAATIMRREDAAACDRREGKEAMGKGGNGERRHPVDSLRPCPFCGGEARTSGERFENTILSRVYCVACGAAGGYRHTEAEAIAAWNIRYHSAFEETVIKAWREIKDYTERTCKPLGTIRYDYEGGYAGTEYETELSCGHKWRDAYGDYPDYCPSCGAKVVGE